ncbi:DUF2442 domain-containing protein [candidate division KSB1 bacterium]|nr:DUF2442 domain-containing protein [candidate division KSB1 bacterium]MBL7093098.1 DUF2442 domain-containing protein [candidate division KSB1 bacterium]
MKWIKEIIDVFPYSVISLWDDNQIRTTDLTYFIQTKAKNPNNSYAQLLDEKRFLEVKCDGTTIYWENGIQIQDIDGTIIPAPLDIDPYILYKMSTLNIENLVDANLLS